MNLNNNGSVSLILFLFCMDYYYFVFATFGINNFRFVRLLLVEYQVVVVNCY